MSVKKPAKPAPEVHVHDLSKLRGTLKAIRGSMSDGWNNILANQAIRTLWFFENSDAYEIRRQRHAAVDALIGIAPRDELEGMVAAQLVACHDASMECYRRAMIGSRRSRAGGRISTRRTSSRGHMRRCSNLSIATVARALKRSRWSTSTSTRAVRPSSAMSRAGGRVRIESEGTTPCNCLQGVYGRGDCARTRRDQADPNVCRSSQKRCALRL
jgi:hypothetical protein